MNITITPAWDFEPIICELFDEYTTMLINSDPVVAAYLKLQKYDDELQHLHRKYGQPDGRLYIANADGQAAGCVGLRKMDDKRCELKRLYVRPSFRGNKIAQQLLGLIIDDARKIGYTQLFLDTLPFLTDALRLYTKFGFIQTDSYNDSPIETTIFMRLDL